MLRNLDRYARKKSQNQSYPLSCIATAQKVVFQGAKISPPCCTIPSLDDAQSQLKWFYFSIPISDRADPTGIELKARGV